MNLDKLKGKIVEKGKSRKTLAEAMGISTQALGKKLSGRTKITIEDAEKLCSILDIQETEEKVHIFLS